MRAWMVGLCVALVVLTAPAEEIKDPGAAWMSMGDGYRAAWYRGWYDGVIAAAWHPIDANDPASRKVAFETMAKLLGNLKPRSVMAMMTEIYEDAANVRLPFTITAIAAVEILEGGDKEAILSDRRRYIAEFHRKVSPSE